MSNKTYLSYTSSNNAFDRVKSNIQNVINAGIPLKLSYTPTSFNGNDYTAFVEYAKSMGIEYRISLLVPSGFGEKNFQNLRLNKNQNEIITKDIKKGEELPIFTQYSCSTNNIYITATGDIYPCNLLENSNFHMGNLFNDSINTIQFNGQNMLGKFKIQEKLCLGCEYKYVCGGRCPATRAYTIRQAELENEGIFPPCAFYNNIENSLKLQFNEL